MGFHVHVHVHWRTIQAELALKLDIMSLKLGLNFVTSLTTY